MQPGEHVQTTALSAHTLTCLHRIMFIDDEVIDQMFAKRVIARTGLTRNLVGLTTPAAALSYFANPDFPAVDLILLDVNMPRMNGFDFLAALQAQMGGMNIPPVILMLSVPLGPHQQAQADEFDIIKDTLTKPLDQNELAHALFQIQNTA